MAKPNYPFFSFSIEPKEGKGLYRTIVFKGGGEFNAKTFADYVTGLILNSPVIDSLEILVPVSEIDSIRNSIERESIVKNSLERRPRMSASLVGFNDRGELKKAICVTEHREDALMDRNEIIMMGVRSIANNNTAILHRAPENCVFEKPSGQRHLYYLRGGALVGSDSQCGFLAYSLLEKFDDEIKCIAIDTMAISPLAYKLISLKNSLKEDKWNPEVYSFHSYGGFNGKSPPDNPQKTYILVSASSSGNMPREIRDYWKIPESQICTLLAFDGNDEDTFVGSILHKVEEPEEKKLDHLTPVKIVGEYFVPRQRKSNQFLLRAKHAPRGIKDAMMHLYNTNVFKIKIDRGLWVDASELGQRDCIVEWFRAATGRKAPASTSHVVYVDRASKSLAEEVSSKLSEYGINTEVISSTSLGKNDETVHSVVVVSAVVMSGDKLLDVSRRLRNVLGRDCSIAYFVGFYIPESHEKKDKFISSLTYSPAREFKYTFDCWQYFPIGKPDVGMSSFERESLQKDEIFEKCSRWKEVSQDEFTNVFWDGLDGKQLTIRRDFAFWPSKFKPDEANNAAVYFTILSVLQNAREKHCFLSSEYEAAVLDPECFARFNDGVIQASLLRGCEHAELNYRGVKEASAFIRDLMISMIERPEPSPVNEALPEFLLALRLEKMRLEDEDVELIKRYLKKSDWDEEIKELLPNSS